jgi:hypothetical protein
MPLAIKERQNEANGRTRIREQCGLTQSRQTSISSNFISRRSEVRLPQTIRFHNKKANAAAARGTIPAEPFTKEMTVLFSRFF